MTDSLWPDDISPQTSLISPTSILREQGALLGNKTTNLVVGAVIKSGDFSEREDYFKYAFYLVAPELSDYRYRLLSIVHSAELYPLRITVDGSIFEELPDDIEEDEEGYLIVRSQDGFMKTLRKIFATKKVKRVIEAIIAQSVGEEQNAQ